MSTLHPNRIQWTCNIGMMCCALGTAAVPVYLTTYSAEFGPLSKSELGAISGILFAGVVAGILTSGPLADRWGARPFVLGGFGLSGLGAMMVANATSYPVLMVAVTVLGFASGVLDMILSPIVAAVKPDRRASALNQLHAFYSIGVVAVVTITATSLWLEIPWRWVMGGLAMLPLGCFVVFMAEALPPLVHPDHERSRFRVLLRNPRFHFALLLIFLGGMAEEGMSQWLPAYAEQGLGYSSAVGGFALGAYGVMQGVGRLTMSRALHWFNGYQLLSFAATMTVACYLLCAWAPLPAVGLVAGIASGFACSALWPTNLGITADQIPHGGATMFGLMAGIGNLGCTVAPWMEGVIADYAGLSVALSFGAIPPMLLLVLVLVAYRWDTRMAA